MNDENNATRIYDSHDETLTILDVLSDKTLEQRNRILKSYSKLHSKVSLILRDVSFTINRILF